MGTTGISPNFRSRFVDLLGAVALDTSWPRSDPGDEPPNWFSSEATGALARELVARLNASSRDHRGALPDIGATHPAYLVLERYERTAGLKDRLGRALRPDAPTGARTASWYMHYSAPVHHHPQNVTLPRLGQPSSPNTAATDALVADLIAEIGAPAFAAARAPYLSYLQATYPDAWFV